MDAVFVLILSHANLVLRTRLRHAQAIRAVERCDSGLAGRLPSSGASWEMSDGRSGRPSDRPFRSFRPFRPFHPRSACSSAWVPGTEPGSEGRYRGALLAPSHSVGNPL
jgi:hypothetical protein